MTTAPPTSDDIDVVPADAPALLERLQALRYRVFVTELGLSPPGADHERGLLVEPLDATGRNFIGLASGTPVGSVRVNVASDGGAEDYIDAYQLATLGEGFEARTAIVTRLIRRGETGAGPLLNKLVGEVLRVVAERKLRHIAIGVSAELVRFYAAMGFAHFVENVVSPTGARRAVLVLDVEDPRHKARQTLAGWLYPHLFSGS